MRNLVYIALFFSQFLIAQSSEDLFEKANQLYKEGEFEKAISTYDSIEKMGYVSSELFYNLGNCYYKLNQVAPTIYNYEKALLLNPLNEDAKNNLIFAKRLTIDNIDELPKSVFDKLNEKVVKKLSYNQWSIVSVVFSFLGSILFLAFYFSEKPSQKRFYFITSITCFLFLAFSLIFSAKEFDESSSKIEAIIFAQEVTVKNAPTENSEEVFILHEGTKVLVLDSVDTWKKIKISDGKIGWIPQENLRLLQLF